MDKDEEDEESDMALLVLSLKPPIGGAGGTKCIIGETCELCLEDEAELDEDMVELEVDSDESELNDLISICKLAVFS